MDFDTYERLSLETNIKHMDAKIKFIEERIQHTDKIINDLRDITNYTQKYLKYLNETKQTISATKKGTDNT